MAKQVKPAHTKHVREGFTEHQPNLGSNVHLVAPGEETWFSGEVVLDDVAEKATSNVAQDAGLSVAGATVGANYNLSVSQGAGGPGTYIFSYAGVAGAEIVGWPAAQQMIDASAANAGTLTWTPVAQAPGALPATDVITVAFEGGVLFEDVNKPSNKEVGVRSTLVKVTGNDCYVAKTEGMAQAAAASGKQEQKIHLTAGHAYLDLPWGYWDEVRARATRPATLHVIGKV